MGNRESAADYDSDMKSAKAAGIDAFALNIATDPYTDAQLNYAYESAANNDMKVFISFDYNYFQTSENALVGAFAENQKPVTRALVQEVCDQFDMSPETPVEDQAEATTVPASVPRRRSTTDSRIGFSAELPTNRNSNAAGSALATATPSPPSAAPVTAMTTPWLSQSTGCTRPS